jgi:hypothetical protein
MPTLNHIEKKCSKCGVKLTYFAYIPGRGEACMKCYTEYAQEKELKP